LSLGTCVSHENLHFCQYTGKIFALTGLGVR
jgi:hypothetical protein